MLRVGIVGLPNAGKSTLFNALTGSRQADVAAYPFCTIEPNVGVIEVRDERLEEVRRLFDSPRAVPSVIEFVDIAGLVAGASTGEGLGNRFLGHIREVDAIAHVVRCFEREGVPRAEGSVDPVADAQTVETELALADLGTIERRRERTARRAHAGEKDAREELSRLERFRAALDAGMPARAIDQHEPGDHELLGELFLLTGKPVIYVVNTGEELIGADDERVAAVRAHAAGQAGGGADAMAICADLEAEVGDLEPDEAAEFLQRRRHRRARHRPAGAPRLPPPRPDHLLHRQRYRGARLGDPGRHRRCAGRRQRAQRHGARASSAPRWSATRTCPPAAAWRRRAIGDCYASRAATTRCATATSS